MKLYLFFLFLLIAPIFAIDANISLNTLNSESPPYYIGTTIKDIRLTLYDDGSIYIPQGLQSINIAVSGKSYTLTKRGNYFYSQLNHIIDVPSNSRLAISIQSNIERLGQDTFYYNIVDPSSIITHTDNLFNTYNENQTVDFNLSFTSKLESPINSISCFLNSPAVKDNKFNCNNLNCVKSFEAKSENNKLLIDAKCIAKTSNRDIPILIKESREISRDLNVVLLNPKNGLISNPFEIRLGIKYPNNQGLESDDIKVLINKDESSLRDLGNNEYAFNYLLMPYTKLDFNLIFNYKGVEYSKAIKQDLVPGLWFWILISVLLLIIVVNVILLIYKIFKKENINELIAERDIYTEKIKKLKEDFLANRISKARHDEVYSEYQINLSSLNSRIIRLRGVTPEEQYSNIEKEIKSKYAKKEEPVSKDDDVPDDLIKALKSNTQKKAELTPSPVVELTKPDNKEKKKNIFSKIFSDDKKDDAAKSEVSKNNSNNDDFDISSWKK